MSEHQSQPKSLIRTESVATATAGPSRASFKPLHEMTEVELERAEVEAMAALQPLAVDEFKMLLGRLLLHYPSRDITAAQHRLVFDDYISDIGGFPADLVIDAFAEWRQHGKPFFPTISELLPGIESATGYRERRLDRLQDLRGNRSRGGE
jgi:hypothetical protein